MLCAEAAICWAFNFNRKRDSCEIDTAGYLANLDGTNDPDWGTGIAVLGRCTEIYTKYFHNYFNVFP